MMDQPHSADQFFKERSAPEPHSKNLLSYDEMIRIDPPSWRVENLIPEGSTAVLFGESNSFKSFVAVDIGCSIAVNMSWHGLSVKPGHVVYVASESAYGIATKRIPAWMAHHNIARERRRGIFLRPVSPLLDDPASLKTFKDDLASVDPIGLLIYDVLAGTMKGSEKNTDVIAAWVRIVGEIETLLSAFRHPFALRRQRPDTRRNASLGIIRNQAQGRRRPRKTDNHSQRRAPQGP